MNWSKDIIAGGINVNYGLFDNLIIAKDLGVDQLNTKANQQTRYTLGLSMKLPISYLYDHFDLKLAKIQLEQTQIEKQSLIKSIREEVYNRYNDLLRTYQKYMILLEDFDTYSVLLQNAEKDFLSNRISIQEVTSVKMANSKAKLDLNDAKNEFIRARWMLEELTGVPIR
jgi:outer membrane protein TolC